MKTFLFAATAWLLAVGVGTAQEPARAPLNRGDAHFVIGWQNLHKEQAQQQPFNNWVNGIFYGGAGGGWYWTDHVKSQIDFGAGTKGRQYRYEPNAVNGQGPPEVAQLSVRQQSVAVAQQYQFFENRWFHPHVGAGAEIARETTISQYQPIFGFDPVTRSSRQLSPARTEGPDHRTIVRPFGEVGFKAYMTRRAFFTADSRLMFRHGIDEVLFRLGFGVDF